MTKLMKSPRNLEIDITSQCNLRCDYCCHFSGPGDVNKDLSKEEWFKFFEELKDCGVMNINISGGEPFYRADLKDLLDSIVKNNMRYSISSNGTLITADMVKFIASTKRCNIVQISIDGPNPEIHDSCRGKGTFQRTLRGIEFLRQNNINVTVRVTINRRNVYYLEEVAKFLLEDIGLPSFSTNSAFYSGLSKQNASHVILTTEERSFAIAILQKLERKYGGRITAMAGPLFEGKEWQKMENACCSGLYKLPGGGNLASCRYIMSGMAVRADGIMIPCSLLSHIELGRINKDKLLDVWQKHPEFKKLRERGNITLKSFQFCQECEYIDFCTGGCPASAYELVGVENHPSPDTCYKVFLESGGTLSSNYI